MDAFGDPLPGVEDYEFGSEIGHGRFSEVSLLGDELLSWTHVNLYKIGIMFRCRSIQGRSDRRGKTLL